MYGSSILDQRCIFHKLKNVADKARTELKGKDQREAKNKLMEQAAHIYEAEHAEMARQRLGDWTQQWRAHAPETVATLERDFEATLVYSQIDTLTREWIRTTSLLERTNRELRCKFRQAVTFGSALGANVAVFLSRPAPSCPAFPIGPGGKSLMTYILSSTLREGYNIHKVVERKQRQRQTNRLTLGNIVFRYYFAIGGSFAIFGPIWGAKNV